MRKNALGGTSNKNLKIIKVKQFNMAILMVYEQTRERRKYLYISFIAQKKLVTTRAIRIYYYQHENHKEINQLMAITYGTYIP